MAEEYVIRVTADESLQAKKKPVSIPGGSSESEDKTADNGDAYIESSKLVWTSAIVPASKAVVSSSLSMIGLSTGNNKLQQRMNIATSVYGKMAGAYQNAKAAAAIAGPMGAAASVTASAIMEVTSIATTSVKHDIEYRNEQQRLGVLNDRAGLTTNRRRR